MYLKCKRIELIYKKKLCTRTYFHKYYVLMLVCGLFCGFFIVVLGNHFKVVYFFFFLCSLSLYVYAAIDVYFCTNIIRVGSKKSIYVYIYICRDALRFLLCFHIFVFPYQFSHSLYIWSCIQ